jgi:hypothetical protein
MLEELQGRKSLRLCLAWLRIRWFDPIAEVSKLPDHLSSAQLLRSFGDRWAAFFVAALWKRAIQVATQLKSSLYELSAT